MVVFDPHGEYGKALAKGQLHFADGIENIEDERDKKALPQIKAMIEKLQEAGAGIQVYSPQHESFRHKYANKNQPLALQFDHFEMDDVAEILPGLTEPQQRVLDVAIRYWRQTDKSEPRDINRLRYFLGDGIDEIRGMG